MNRRNFLKKAGVASACACGSFILIDIGAIQIKHIREAPEKSYRIEGDKLIIDTYLNKVLTSDGGAIKLKLDYKGRKMKILVFRKDANTYMAFENRCSHGGMALKYKPELDEIHCTSLGHSVYDMEGEVLKGPAPSAIQKYELQKDDHLLIITLQ